MRVLSPPVYFILNSSYSVKKWKNQPKKGAQKINFVTNLLFCIFVTDAKRSINNSPSFQLPNPGAGTPHFCWSSRVCQFRGRQEKTVGSYP
jgi:hypothetical protein